MRLGRGGNTFGGCGRPTDLTSRRCELRLCHRAGHRLDAHLATIVHRRGGPAREADEPTGDHMVAMRVRAVDIGDVPCAGFPSGRRPAPPNAASDPQVGGTTRRRERCSLRGTKRVGAKLPKTGRSGKRSKLNSSAASPERRETCMYPSAAGCRQRLTRSVLHPVGFRSEASRFAHKRGRACPAGEKRVGFSGRAVVGCSRGFQARALSRSGPGAGRCMRRPRRRVQRVVDQGSTQRHLQLGLGPTCAVDMGSARDRSSGQLGGELGSNSCEVDSGSR